MRRSHFNDIDKATVEDKDKEAKEHLAAMKAMLETVPVPTTAPLMKALVGTMVQQGKKTANATTLKQAQSKLAKEETAVDDKELKDDIHKTIKQIKGIMSSFALCALLGSPNISLDKNVGKGFRKEMGQVTQVRLDDKLPVAPSS